MNTKLLRKELELTLVKTVGETLAKVNTTAAKKIKKTTKEASKTIAKKFVKIIKAESKIKKTTPKKTAPKKTNLSPKKNVKHAVKKD